MSDALAQLVRLHGWRLDEKRRESAELQRLADRLGEEIGLLEAELARERQAADRSLELRRAFSGFAGQARDRIAKLAASRREVEARIERVREEVSTIYRELKTYEQAAHQRASRRQAALRRREQILSDELGLSMFRRRQ